MKTKVLLGLAICCLLSALVGSVVTNTVQAQMQVAPGTAGGPYELYTFPPMNVLFPEDPLRQHGLQVESFCEPVLFSTYGLIGVVPADKRFIITDVSHNVGDGLTIILSSDISGTNVKGRFSVSSYQIASFNSGVVYEPGESIYLYHTHSSGVWFTISGYYVDI